VDNKNVGAVKRCLRIHFSRWLLRQRYRKRERAPAAWLAVYRDTPIHSGDQVGGDRQAEACPAVTARVRVVALDKILEEALGLIPLYTDPGVAYRKANKAAIAGILNQVDAKAHFALHRELHRIADQVPKHLPEPDGIANEKTWN
jgi:hypothetical protein